MPSVARTGLAAAALAVIGGSLALAEGPLEEPAELVEALQSGAPKTVEGLRLLQQQVRRVVSLSRPVTVAVEMNDSVGSGVLVSGDGLVLTAGHVVSEPNRSVWVRFSDGSRVRARSLGVNHVLDSGLVRIIDTPPGEEEPSADPSTWPHAPLAEAPPEPGEWVVCLGQPNGFVEGRAPPVRLGRILHVSEEAINTDATLVGGDSGGPLLNLRGEVVGIHSKIGQAITSNYHVPTTAYQREWERLLAGRMRGVPEGEDPDDWRPEVGLAARRLGSEIVVTQVFADGPAEEAGVAVGDVLVRLAGEEIATPADLVRLASECEPYDRITLTVRRGEKVTELSVWLGRIGVDFPGGILAQEGR